MELISQSIDDLHEVAETLIPRIKERPIVLFRGELGAGKTTLIKEIGRQLGVENEMSSPSFGLVNHHQVGEKKIYHMDLYRVEDVSEIFEIGLPEILDSGDICLVEWPEMAEEIWQEYECLSVRINLDKQFSRHIFVE